MTTKQSGDETEIIKIKDIDAKERFCLTLISEGHTPKEIAFILAMTEERVEFLLQSIETKLKASNRVEAIAIAMRHNII